MSRDFRHDTEAEPNMRTSSDAVAKREPYAYEFGRSDGDYTLRVYIERNLPPKPHPDWPVTPLYLDPPPTSELEAEIARLTKLLHARDDFIVNQGLWGDFVATRLADRRVHEGGR